MTGHNETPSIDVADDMSLRRPGMPDLVLGPGLSSLGWFHETFCASPGSEDRVSFAEVDCAAAKVPDGSTGVLFISAGGRGSFFGMSYQTDLAQCARAVYEGLTHAAVTVLHEHSVQTPFFKLTGPGASNPMWRELLAKSTGVPILSETGTYEPTPQAVRSHAALHDLYTQCIATIESLEVGE